MGSPSATLSDRMMPHLEALAQKMLGNRHFGHLATASSLMAGLSRGGWERLSNDDKDYFLKKMSSDFHPKGMGDSEYGLDADYRSILELISDEQRVIRAK
jgi:hypothetical protein